MGKRKKIVVRSIIVLIILTVVIISLGFELYRDMAWVCAGCKSCKSAIHWRFGFVTSEESQTSPLEEWMIEHEVVQEHDWRHINGTGRNIYGSALSHRHGKSPPVRSFPPECMSEYVNSASDADVRKLIEVLDNGSDKDQEIFIQQITDNWFEEKLK